MVRARVPSLLKKGARAFTDREHFQDMKIEITIQTDKNKKQKTLAFTDREHLQYMRTKLKIANNKSQKTKQISKKHKTKQKHRCQRSPSQEATQTHKNSKLKTKMQQTKTQSGRTKRNQTKQTNKQTKSKNAKQTDKETTNKEQHTYATADGVTCAVAKLPTWFGHAQ